MTHDPVRVNLGPRSAEIAILPAPGQTQRVPLPLVLDFSDAADLIGIEALNLLSTIGGAENSLGAMARAVPRIGDGLRYSYDDESDAFYLQIKRAKSRAQRTATGAAVLDASRTLIGIEVCW